MASVDAAMDRRFAKTMVLVLIETLFLDALAIAFFTWLAAGKVQWWQILMVCLALRVYAMSGIVTFMAREQ